MYIYIYIFIYLYLYAYMYIRPDHRKQVSLRIWEKWPGIALFAVNKNKIHKNNILLCVFKFLDTRKYANL